MEQQVATQKLPAGLAGVLNSPDMSRDSAYYSSTDASSKHTSAASCAGPSPHSSVSPSAAAYRSPSSQPDKTPSPTSGINRLPQPLVSPTTSSMSVASMVSPTTPGSGDLRHLAHRPQSYESSAPNSASLIAAAEYDLSRRESVDSRINQGIGELRLGGNSPYATHNHSTTSIHNTFAQQQRQPRPGIDNLSVHRISNGYQPSADRTPDGQIKAPARTAPAITGPAVSQIARAAEPTKGQAWAFPEEEIHRMPSTTSQHSHSLIDSRRSSIADSLASSQFTTESRMPSGQRRFDDQSPTAGIGGPLDYNQRLSGASGEFPSTHHHALQHKQLDDIQSENGSTHTGSQPYSRTPELRVSHKLAERKRRTEMKELFEQLRDLMPQERGSKASKWEILTKAITEHQRLQDTIRSATQHSASMTGEIAILKNELQAMRVENQQLRADMANIAANQQRAAGGAATPIASVASGPVQPPTSASGMSDPFGRPPQRPELPPLRSLSGGLPPPSAAPTSAPPPPPDSMTGVRYESSRVEEYRPQEQQQPY